MQIYNLFLILANKNKEHLIIRDALYCFITNTISN